jgi:hypothetical protein
MLAVAFTFVVGLASCAGPEDKAGSASSRTPPKPHPLAPSLPATTDEDEDRFDRVIDRFILYDTGKLSGKDAKKALEDFQRLPPEAIFALVRGLNRAAAINDSCPALVIAKRIATQIRSTKDRELIQYARENIGAGVGASRHAAVIKDLRLTCSQRQSALDNEKNTDLRGPSRP